jgi:integrase
MDDGTLIDSDPKSHAGTRTVSFAREITPELRWHLECFAQAGGDGLVFVEPKGGRLRRSNLRKVWHQARGAVGFPELHFHDLRHTGNTMAAAQGASLRELMERMGHSSTRAALIYLHATRERDEVLAAGMESISRTPGRRGCASARRPRNGHAVRSESREGRQMSQNHAAGLRLSIGAGEGNRTLMTSLEDR